MYAFLFLVLVVVLMLIAVEHRDREFWMHEAHHLYTADLIEEHPDATCGGSERIRAAYLRAPSDECGNACENLACPDGQTTPTSWTSS